MDDAFGMYALVLFVGFEEGWYTLCFTVGVVYRFTGKPIGWNTSLATLIILTAGLTGVIYAVLQQAPTLGGPYAYLPASFIGSSFFGGLASLCWGLYRSTRTAASKQER